MERQGCYRHPSFGTFTFAFAFAYNADGQLNTLTRPNGVTSTNTYDGAGRLAGLTYKNGGGTAIAAYAYTLDAAGNRTSATTDGATEHYTIDPAGRLTGVRYADGTAITFGYDASGNRTSMTAGGSTTAYTYDAAGELKSAGSTSYSYDAAGNRLTAGSASYSYDSFGNLASATSGATTIAYQTNGSGLRVSATSGPTTSTYNWDSAAALPSLLSDGAAGYLSADTALLAETSASTSAYPLTDALGSVRATSGSTGSVTASASYGVYGDVRSSSGSLGSLGYTGGLTDASGLVYLQARSLDTASGSFTSRDPMTPGGPGITGFNPYAYAAQNPTTLTDPSGRYADTEYGLLGMIRTIAVPALAEIGASVSALLLWLLLLSLIPITAGCAAGVACPINVPVPWAPRTGPHPGQAVTWDDVDARIKDGAEARGITLTAEQIGLAREACRRSAFSQRLGGDPAACAGDYMPVIYYGATWTDAGGTKPLAATTLHIYAAQLQFSAWSILTYGENESTNRHWYDTAGICESYTDTDPSKSTTCDEYPFWTTREGGPLSIPTPSVVQVPRAETQPQGTAMSSFYWFLDGHYGHYSGAKAFGVVPQVLFGVVLPLPTYWVAR